MRALILSAGLGTRLKPITNDTPKALVPVLGRPMIVYTLDLLEKNGFTEVMVNIHHLAEKMKAFVVNWNSSNKKLKISIQDEKDCLLGSGGGVLRASSWLFEKEETAMVCNADVIYEPSVSTLIQKHQKVRDEHGALCTLLLMEHPEAGNKYGGVEVDKNFILGFGKEKGKHYLHFPGMYLIEKSTFENLKVSKKDFSMREEIWVPLTKSQKLTYLLYQGYYYDLGTPEDLKIAEEEISKLNQ